MKLAGSLSEKLEIRVSDPGSLSEKLRNRFSNAGKHSEKIAGRFFHAGKRTEKMTDRFPNAGKAPTIVGHRKTEATMSSRNLSGRLFEVRERSVALRNRERRLAVRPSDAGLATHTRGTHLPDVDIKPDAVAIPKSVDHLPKGKYGPIFPKTPAC